MSLPNYSAIHSLFNAFLKKLQKQYKEDKFQYIINLWAQRLNLYKYLKDEKRNNTTNIIWK